MYQNIYKILYKPCCIDVTNETPNYYYIFMLKHKEYGKNIPLPLHKKLNKFHIASKKQVIN